MTNMKLTANPFIIGDKEVYLNQGTQLTTQNNETVILDRVEIVHVADVSQPFTYEQETIDGNTQTIEVPGEITFWMDNNVESGGAFYRAKVEQQMINFHKNH